MQRNSTPWHFIVNPAAGGGRGRLRWRKVLPKLRAALPNMTFEVSTPATSLAALTLAALKAGHRALVGVGGDGTHHHIVNALAGNDLLNAVTYVPLSVGSGNDWIRTLGTPTALRPWLTHLRAGARRHHNVGVIDFLNTGQRHYYVNVAGFAYDAEVVRIAEEERLRHRWMYPLLATGYLNEYVAPTVHAEFMGTEFTGPVHTVNVGVGRYSGGGMSFVPHANPYGEALAVTIIPKLPSWKIIVNAWRLYRGSVARLPGVVTTHAPAIILRPAAGTLECEADGEWLGTGPVSLSIHPKQLTVLAV